MTDQAPELLPCPFCGTMPHSHADNIQHNPDDLPWNGQWIIECNACPVDSSTWAATQDKAITQWNTRPPSERPVAQMREALANRLGEIAGRVPLERDRETIIEACNALRALTAERPEAAVAWWRWRFKTQGHWSAWISLDTDGVDAFRELQGHHLESGHCELQALYTAPQSLPHIRELIALATSPPHRGI